MCESNDLQIDVIPNLLVYGIRSYKYCDTRRREKVINYFLSVKRHWASQVRHCAKTTHGFELNLQAWDHGKYKEYPYKIYNFWKVQEFLTKAWEIRFECRSFKHVTF